MSKKLSGFLVSLLYLLLGVVVLIYKSSILSTMKYIIGVALIIVGAIRVISTLKKNSDSKKLGRIGDFTVGVIIAIVGILLLLPFFENVFAYAFGIFFIIDGAGKLITALGSANGKNAGWWVSLVIALLIIGVGVFIILKWSLIVDYIAIVVGVVLIVSAIQGFISLLSGKKK